jgi:DNA-binding NtrC family response regulator
MELRKQVRLLVLEGEPEYQRHLQEIIDLCSHQYDIVAEFASSGGAARKALESFGPSVVLMDMHAADREAMALMKGCHEREVPVVATGEPRSREVEEQALKNGAVVFITRSEDPDDLEVVLHTLASVAGQSQVRH